MARPSMIGNEKVTGYARHYLILRELGRGGMGVVYKGFDPSLKRFVAIKTTQNDPDRIAWLKREALASSNLRHPNIIEVYGFDPEHEPPFFVMEYVEGKSLESVLKEEGSFSWKKATKLGMVIARALEYAHSQKVVHRDVKPANVLVNNDGDLKLMDFGLAYDPRATTKLTDTGHVLGTPAYVPPEMAVEGDGSAYHDPRLDIYSFGAMLYEMVVGRPPFEGPTAISIMSKKVRFDAPSPKISRKDIPKDLETIVLKCLERNPNKRYQCARDLAEDLEACSKYLPIKARPISVFERGWRLALRHREVSIASTCVVLGALAFGGKVFVDRSARADFIAKTFLEGYDLEVKGSYENALEVYAKVLSLESVHRGAREGRVNCLMNLARAAAKAEDFVAASRWYSKAEDFGVKDVDLDRLIKGTAHVSIIGDVPVEVRVYTVNEDGSLGSEKKSMWEVPYGCDNLAPFLKGSPKLDADLPFGNYLTVLRSGDTFVRWPFVIRRNERKSFSVKMISPPEGFVYIPGSTGVKPFFIGAREVSFGEYLEFCDSIADPDEQLKRLPGVVIQLLKDHPQATRQDVFRNLRGNNLPVMDVSYDDAVAYVAWAGARLPSEEEWCLAAFGVDGRPFPTGKDVPVGPDGNPLPNVWRTRRSDFSGSAKDSLEAVGTNKYDISIYGVRDLIGNVGEFTATLKEAVSGRRVLSRGSAWSESSAGADRRYNSMLDPKERIRWVGFRLAKDAR